MKTYLKIHPSDNIAVALVTLAKGTTIENDGINVRLTEDIPQGHKFSLTDLKKGDQIIKYGSPIGIASHDINIGSWVHIHNIHTSLDSILNYTYTPTLQPLVTTEERYFQGYRRTNGKVGVRNELWIIPTVGCINIIATSIEHKGQHLVSGSIDAIAAFPHPYGCSQMGDDQEHT